MIVDMIDKMGTDLSVVNAARVSYAKSKNKLDDNDKKLINFLAEHKHWSPFAHASIQFRIKGTAATTFEINDISLVFKEKRIK